MALKLKLSTSDYLKITYKLFFGFAIVGIIMGFWIHGLLTLDVHDGAPKGTPRENYWNFFALNGETYSVQIFSYFTIQSNLLCAFIFIFAGFMHKKENRCKLLKNGVVQAVAVYITITCIIYNGLLLPSTIAAGDTMSPLTWFQLMWEHIVEPLSFIIYFLFLFENRIKRTGYQYSLIHYVGLYTIYLVAYMVFILIKGYLILKSGGSTLPAGQHFDYPGLFQYFFLNFKTKTFGLIGYIWFVIVFFIVLGLETGFIMLYTLIANTRVKMGDTHRNNELIHRSS